ncbi:MAG: phospholipid-binding protein [Roseovarius sp.]|nr:phospholipid-binding protein [Roseovarius sp.]
MRLFSLSLAALALTATTAAAEFTISFEWGDIPSCRTGNPNTVGSPAFVLRGVPAGTTSIEFTLKDRDAPNYSHGGGRLKVGSDGKLPFGAFKYKSPCPPGGVHTYVWTATARADRKVLARATATRKYPE